VAHAHQRFSPLANLNRKRRGSSVCFGPVRDIR
jgi:hypothetical protein